MTWIVKPQEIAYQSQNRAFWTVIEKLNLSDGSGKIRDDIDFVERLENMPKSELKDWEELDNVTFYMVRHIALDSYVEDPIKKDTRYLSRDMVKIWRTCYIKYLWWSYQHQWPSN